MNYPEEFLTDSPVHISKLSNSEFKGRRKYLDNFIEKKTEIFGEGHAPEWDHGTADQFKKVLENRASCSLPLPDPLDMARFEKKNLLAIFGKMHSRSFARSMRLCKEVNQLLAKNLTKFSIRIRGMELQISDVFDSSRPDLQFPKKFLMVRCVCYNWAPIEDPSSILPFTFTGLSSRWDGESFREQFDQMKWPFLNRQILIRDDTRLHPTPWMTGLDCLCFSNLDMSKDSTQAVLENWKLLKDLNPKEMWFSVNTPDSDGFWSANLVPVPELLASAPTVSISNFPKNYGIIRLVKEWRSGEWNHSATSIRGSCDEARDDIDRAVDNCFTFKFDGFTLVFVPNPNGDYLLLKHSQENIGEPFEFTMMSNVRFLSQLLPNEHQVLLHNYPIDYSAYSGNIDSLIDPEAFCDLFAKYGSEEGYPQFY